MSQKTSWAGLICRTHQQYHRQWLPNTEWWRIWPSFQQNAPRSFAASKMNGDVIQHCITVVKPRQNYAMYMTKYENWYRHGDVLLYRFSFCLLYTTAKGWKSTDINTRFPSTPIVSVYPSDSLSWPCWLHFNDVIQSKPTAIKHHTQPALHTLTYLGNGTLYAAGTVQSTL